MTKPIARDPMYRKRAFDADIIELCVRWYITYRLRHSAPRPNKIRQSIRCPWMHQNQSTSHT
jgi:hypothetical protein